VNSAQGAEAGVAAAEAVADNEAAMKQREKPIKPTRRQCNSS